MRAHEIMETAVSPSAEHMMLKMRKGSAASLNAKLLTEIIGYLHGWKIENTKVMKLSDGGWVLNTTPFGEAVRKMHGNHGGKAWNTGRITYYGEFDTERESDYNTMSKAEYEQMKTVILPLIQANMSKKGRYEVRDLQFGESKRGSHQRFEISFELYVLCSAYIITASDGQTYEVCGDYKNGAIGATTFDTFFKWAVENTDFMDQILQLLQMEPHEKRADPRAPYRPQPGTPADVMKVFDLLSEMTADIKEQQRESMKEYLIKILDRFIDYMKEGEKDRAKNLTAEWGDIIVSTYDRDNKRLRVDWEEKLDAYVAETVDGMQNMFVRKNTMKLAPIVSAKGNLSDQKVLSIHTRQGIIEAMLKLTFADGSSFRVDQNMVWSHTRDRWNNVTHFTRFPTTFHAVVMPDGSKMGMPSEERMNEIFAKA